MQRLSRISYDEARDLEALTLASRRGLPIPKETSRAENTIQQTEIGSTEHSHPQPEGFTESEHRDEMQEWMDDMARRAELARANAKQRAEEARKRKEESDRLSAEFKKMMGVYQQERPVQEGESSTFPVWEGENSGSDFGDLPDQSDSARHKGQTPETPRPPQVRESKIIGESRQVEGCLIIHVPQRPISEIDDQNSQPEQIKTDAPEATKPPTPGKLTMFKEYIAAAKDMWQKIRLMLSKAKNKITKQETAKGATEPENGHEPNPPAPTNRTTPTPQPQSPELERWRTDSSEETSTFETKSEGVEQTFTDQEEDVLKWDENGYCHGLSKLRKIKTRQSLEDEEDDPENPDKSKTRRKYRGPNR